MISRIRSFSRSMRSMRTMQCSERRSLDGRRTRWSRRSRRGGRPWTSGKWMTVRVRCRVTLTGWGSGRWTSGTSTLLVTSRRIAPRERERASTAKVSTRVKARVRRGGAQARRVLEVLEGPSEPDSRCGRAGQQHNNNTTTTQPQNGRNLKKQKWPKSHLA